MTTLQTITKILVDQSLNEMSSLPDGYEDKRLADLLSSDLGIDSLDTEGILMAIELEFDIDVLITDLTSTGSLRDFANWVDSERGKELAAERMRKKLDGAWEILMDVKA